MTNSMTCDRLPYSSTWDIEVVVTSGVRLNAVRIRFFGFFANMVHIGLAGASFGPFTALKVV